MYISSDQNFQKNSKKPQLIALGTRKILRPVEAVNLLIEKKFILK